jgi:hypothetical protein
MHRQEESTFFEERSKNFRPFGVRVGATLTPYERKFFGSFLQKRTACFCRFPHRPGAHLLFSFACWSLKYKRISVQDTRGWAF